MLSWDRVLLLTQYNIIYFSSFREKAVLTFCFEGYHEGVSTMGVSHGAIVVGEVGLDGVANDQGTREPVLL